MNFQEFANKSQRENQIQNDQIHYFSKYFCNVVAFSFYKLKFSPNLITLSFLIMGLLSAFAFYQKYFFLGWLSWRLMMVFDMADGSVARATEKFSKVAYIFDKFNHLVINILLIFIFAENIKNFFLLYLILVSYLNYYLFNNFIKKNITYKSSVLSNFIKDLLTFEGFILSVILLNVFNNSNLIDFIFIFYSLMFISIFFYKIYIYKR